VSEIISREALLRAVDEWLKQGVPVLGPSRINDAFVAYAPLASSDALALDGYIHPRNSIKEAVFPKHEKIYAYHIKGSGVELEDPERSVAKQIVLAARPCDAAALPILDHVFNWDFKDAFYNARRAATTVVTLACTEHDAQCFCTSVGLGPAAENGSDAMLLPLGDGTFEVRCFTDKGRELFAGKTESSGQAAKVPAGPPERLDVGPITEFLKDSFDNPIWNELTLRCLGCGACAYECPTCHCFDIVDEGNAAGGYRAKNWDSCQFEMFTMHASGHNPRARQAQRQRQRVMHKFSIYPQKFGEVLCTGCGNCTRNCPVSLGILNTLMDLAAHLDTTGAK